jgi:DNA-directed RNA polymerase specialized sigma24 family protein
VIAMQHFINRYDGVIEEWKVNLAVARIRAFGFPHDQWPDLLQRLVLAMRRFEFDPEKANGAKESTILCKLIHRCLISRRISQQRRHTRLNRYRATLGVTPANANRHPRFVERDLTPLQVDVRLALAGLQPEQRRVCDAILQGNSARQIARDLGCPPHAVRRVIADIRRHFEGIGLDGWIRG